MKIIDACSFVFLTLMYVFGVLYMKTGLMWCKYASRGAIALEFICAVIRLNASLKEARKKEDESEEH